MFNRQITHKKTEKSFIGASVVLKVYSATNVPCRRCAFVSVTAVRAEHAAHIRTTASVADIEYDDDDDKYFGHTASRTRIKKCDKEKTVQWKEQLALVIPNGDTHGTKIIFQLWESRRSCFSCCSGKTGDNAIAWAEMSLSELKEEGSISLLMSDYNDQVCEAKGNACFLEVKLLAHMDPERGTVEKPLASDTAKTDIDDAGKPPKHAMMLTRGTRGDVEPFVALARALAETLGWHVTIVAELRWKNFIKKESRGIKQGRIRFRPSGGDTMKKLDEPLAKWAVQNAGDLLQMVMLSRSETEFFPSEPAFYHWASTMQPDVLFFGFTVTHIALILSESLHIPVIGFILQPTVIPSAQYEPVLQVTSSNTGILSSILSKINSAAMGHSVNHLIRDWVMENDPISAPLNTMRRRRGLSGFIFSSREKWAAISDYKIPVLIPMNEKCFGGRPSDWPPGVTFTEFVFLRNEGQSLAPDLLSFIDTAKANASPIVVVAFSSMPVNRKDILRICCEMCTVRQRPSIIAAIGNQDRSHEDVPQEVLTQSQKLRDEGRLKEIAGAPFGLLFPLCDCLIVHGGLGCTAEALRCGVPIIITGVLLMDQRFWGRRVEQLGIGPEPVHISKFFDVCYSNLEKALDPEGPWQQNAKVLKAELENASETGLDEAVAAVQASLVDIRSVREPSIVERKASGQTPVVRPAQQHTARYDQVVPTELPVQAWENHRG
eukprot:TRINITY_DN88747_c0_g1_i1.p1 TRINITY_DN88747_c0_g1~~TRINITY_DN88747_c0_g1_i1.p1  ORF type:complete len:718 (+),score=86.07 TRINITY_DN88747_c0_g1_i1:59-2212(+)